MIEPIDEDGPDGWCWRCLGDGCGIRGHDWDNDDPVNEPDGEVEECDCCGGSGCASDCVYW